ncbi:hypothetical protein TRFO_40845 [Tritrichomonas foetus]|uniref:Tyrosine-protein kinase ephrin type A/B receptor-like domain-containing protein n=1 Tax=Tritrichomonas foetus TaxID=1144522 RepID=A0A1J4J245_9EUKA|nr:hypothetical protein TRFO_40845 [Tritrichomonas foetus]|eukprot:OHS92833.1 hypothetical protein TRFO_40845 [Tritrichomonas foetus]
MNLISETFQIFQFIMFFLFLPFFTFSFTSEYDDDLLIVTFTKSEIVPSFFHDGPIKFVGQSFHVIQTNVISAANYIEIDSIILACDSYILKNASETNYYTSNRPYFFIMSQIQISSMTENTIFIPLFSHSFDISLVLSNGTFVIKDTVKIVESYQLENAVLLACNEDLFEIFLYNITGFNSLVVVSVPFIGFNSINGDIELRCNNSLTFLSFTEASSFNILRFPEGCSGLNGELKINELFINSSFQFDSSTLISKNSYIYNSLISSGTDSLIIFENQVEFIDTIFQNSVIAKFLGKVDGVFSSVYSAVHLASNLIYMSNIHFQSSKLIIESQIDNIDIIDNIEEITFMGEDYNYSVQLNSLIQVNVLGSPLFLHLVCIDFDELYFYTNISNNCPIAVTTVNDIYCVYFIEQIQFSPIMFDSIEVEYLEVRFFSNASCSSFHYFDSVAIYDYKVGSPIIQDCGDNAAIMLYNVTEFPTYHTTIPSMILVSCNVTINDDNISCKIETFMDCTILIRVAEIIIIESYFLDIQTEGEVISFIGECIINSFSGNSQFIFNEQSLVSFEYIETAFFDAVFSENASININICASNAFSLKMNENTLLNIQKLENNMASFYIIGNGSIKIPIEEFGNNFKLSDFYGSLYLRNVNSCLFDQVNFDTNKFLYKISFNNSELSFDSSNVEIQKIEFWNSNVYPQSDFTVEEISLSNSLISGGNINLKCKYINFRGSCHIIGSNIHVYNSFNSLFTTHFNVGYTEVYIILSDFRVGGFNHFIFGDNGADGNFTFYGKIVFVRDTFYHMSNNQYFFANIIFEENVSLDNSFEIPIDQTNADQFCFSCNSSFISATLINESIYTTCSKRLIEIDPFLFREYDCYTENSGGTLICPKMFFEYDFDPVTKTGKRQSTISVLAVEESYYEFDGIVLSINDFQAGNVEVNLQNDCNITINDRTTATFDHLSLSNNSNFSLYLMNLQYSFVKLTDNSFLTIFNSNEISINFINEIYIENSTIYGHSNSPIVVNVGYFTMKNGDIHSLSLNLFSDTSFYNELILSNTIISADSQISTTYYNISFLGDHESYIYLENNAYFFGNTIIEGSFVINNNDAVFDLSMAYNDIIRLGGITLNCTIFFPETAILILIGGSRNATINENANFVPRNIPIKMKNNVTLISFYLTESLQNENGTVTFVNYINPINFSLSGSGVFDFQDKLIRINHSLTISNSRLLFQDDLYLLKASIFTGFFKLSGLNHSIIYSNNQIIFDDFSCYGSNIANIHANKVLIKSSNSIESFTQSLQYKNNWENINFYVYQEFIVNNSMLEIDLFNNSIFLTNCNVFLYSGSIVNISTFYLNNCSYYSFNDFINCYDCKISNSKFYNIVNQINCLRMEIESTHINGYFSISNIEYFTGKDVFIYFETRNLNYPIFYLENQKSLNLTIAIVDDFGRISNTSIPIVYIGTPTSRLPRISVGNTENIYQYNIKNDIYYIDFFRCENGEYYDNSSQKCVKCLNGHYCQYDSISKCPEGTFNEIEGSSECIPCPIGYYTNEEGQLACNECPENFTTAYLSSKSFSDCICQEGFSFNNSLNTCTECPYGYRCNILNMNYNETHIDNGLYLDEFGGIHYCLSVQSCIDGQCAENLEGISCAKCIHGFFHITINRCKKCPRGSKGFIAVILIAIIFHFSIFIIAFYKYDRVSMHLIIFYQFTQSFLALFYLNYPWPDEFGVIAIIFETINLNFQQLNNCIADEEVWLQGVVFLLINIILLIVFIIAVIVSVINKKKVKEILIKPQVKTVHDLDDLADFFINDGTQRNLTDNVVPSDYYFYSMKVIKFIISYFYATFGIQFRWLLISTVIYDNALMIYSYILVDSVEYQKYTLLPILNGIFLIGYFVIFVIMFYYMKYKRTLIEFYSIFGNIVSNIKFESYNYPIFMFVKIVLYNMAVFGFFDLSEALYVVVILIAICFSYHLHKKPFFDNRLNIIQTINISFELMMTIMGLIIFLNQNDFVERIILIVFNIVVTFCVCVLVFLIYDTFKHIKEKYIEEADIISQDVSFQTNPDHIIIMSKNKMISYIRNDFDLHPIIKWYIHQTSPKKLEKLVLIISKTLNDEAILQSTDAEIMVDFQALCDQINEIFLKYQKLIHSSIMSQDIEACMRSQKFLTGVQAVLANKKLSRHWINK